MSKIAKSDRYQIKITTKYIQEYGKEYFRALIVNENGRIIKIGTQDFNSEELAYSDGQSMLEEIKRSEKSIKDRINLPNMVFKAEPGFKKYTNKAVPFIGVLTSIACFTGFAFSAENLVIGTCLLAAGLFTGGFTLLITNTISGNTISYVLNDGELYRVFEGNENIGQANILSDANHILAAASIIEGERNRRIRQEMLNVDSYFYDKQNTDECWRIIDVKNIVSRNRSYKILCRIEKGRSLKQCDKTLYIRDGYNNFEELINCFKYIKSCSE